MIVDLRKLLFTSSILLLKFIEDLSSLIYHFLANFESCCAFKSSCIFLPRDFLFLKSWGLFELNWNWSLRLTKVWSLLNHYFWYLFNNLLVVSPLNRLIYPLLILWVMANFFNLLKLSRKCWFSLLSLPVFEK